MARRIYRIDQFHGIDQSVSENALSPACSPDACNMDVSDGELTVAKGYTRCIQQPVPGEGRPHRLIHFRTGDGEQVIVAAGASLYAFKNDAWGLIYTFAGGLAEGRLAFCEAQIDGADYLLIASGEQEIVKYNGTSAVSFGSADLLSDRPVSCLAIYRNRLFCAGDRDHPNRLYWSKLPGGGRTIEDWSDDPDSLNVSGGHTEIGSISGDPVTGMAALSNQLLIFKRRSIYRLIGDKPSNFTVERLDTDVESTAQTAITACGDQLYFMTDGGMCRFNGVTAAYMPDARRIQGILSSASTADCRAACLRDRLCFAIRLEDGDALIEYDLIRRAYMLRCGFGIGDIAAWDGRLHLINNARYVYELGSGDTYDGAPIEAHWRTPLTDLYDKSGVKAMRSLCFRGAALGSDTPLITTVAVDGLASTYKALLSTEGGGVSETPLMNEGRTFSLTFRNEAGGRFRLSGGVELGFETWRRVE